MSYLLGTPLKGVNGTVVFDGHFVSITRKGFIARATVGKGEKRIPLASITAVQWKPPGMMVNGFIQFSLSGGSERRSQFGKQSMDAVDDENTVMVSKGKMEADFLELRNAIEMAIAQRHAPVPATAPPVHIQPTSPVGVADELAKLASLRDSGVLTDDEFAAQKGPTARGLCFPRPRQIHAGPHRRRRRSASSITGLVRGPQGREETALLGWREVDRPRSRLIRLR
ncbi:MAG: hypothetical protein B7C55_04625 [Actinomycetales bacterium mxb001]|nr:MAG: hypothetical protein B7C55_04625 [Actinomycetales bacterium mxb001]